MNEKRCIPGIYNYCDEQEENAQYPESGDPKSKVFWERLGAKLVEAMQLMQVAAADMNIDRAELPDELASEPEDESEPEFTQARARTAGTWLKEKLPTVYDEFTYERELGLAGVADRAGVVSEAG